MMTPEERMYGASIDSVVPRPAPDRYGLLECDQREWRGRASIVFWLTGCEPEAAWPGGCRATP